MSQNTLTELVFEKSNRGLDIILEYYPQASGLENTNKSFKIRSEEKTASASIKLIKNIWFVTDFGNESKGKHAINVIMEEEKLEYNEAVILAAKKLGIPLNKKSEKPNIEFKKAKKTDVIGCEFDLDSNFNDFTLKTIGPEVTPEIISNYHGLNCTQFTRITEKEGNPEKKIITTATDTYPIIVFQHKNWQKIYQPLNENKAFRFSHNGNRPQEYLNGLDRLVYIQNEHKEYVSLNWDSDKMKREPKKSDFRLDNVIIASGDRDALNIASFGFNVVWLNSETEKLSFDYYKQLKSLSNQIYVLPDIDKTGIEQGLKLALQYDDIKIIWLPEYLKQSKDFRGNPRKDFTDFVKLKYSKGNTESENAFKNLLNRMVLNAMPMRFWDQKYLPKTDNYKYTFNNTYARHFIENSGFYRYKEPFTQNDYEFIKVNDNVIEKVEHYEIKNYLSEYLYENAKPIDLRNTLSRTTQLSFKQLAELKKIEPNFTKGYENSQNLFFKDKVWEVSKHGINEFKTKDFKNQVWKNELIDFSPKKSKQRQFTITKLSSGGYDIEIHNKNNKHLNYLINTCRMFWREELEKPFYNPLTRTYNLEEKDKYYKENRFNISGPNLTAEQIHEQKQHLVNKLFIIGYLCSSYKNESKAWLVWNMDYEIPEDITESNGGTGKSLFFKTLNTVLSNQKQIGCRSRDKDKDQFFYDGVTPQTDLVNLEDVNMYFNLDVIIVPVTADFEVNPKSSKRYTMPFSNSPKIAATSNYMPSTFGGTEKRRVLITFTSDYYHQKNDNYLETRQVEDDFNGKRLITHFDDEDFNAHFNLIAECLEFFFNTPEKVEAPSHKLEERSIKKDINPTFEYWADTYLEGLLNKEFNREKALEDFKKASGFNKFSAQKFKKNIEAWSKQNKYTLNDPEKCNLNSSGRIQRRVNKILTEFFIITTPEGVVEKNDTDQTLNDLLDQNNTNDQDLDF